MFFHNISCDLRLIRKGVSLVRRDMWAKFKTPHTQNSVYLCYLKLVRKIIVFLFFQIFNLKFFFSKKVSDMYICLENGMLLPVISTCFVAGVFLLQMILRCRRRNKIISVFFYFKTLPISRLPVAGENNLKDICFILKRWLLYTFLECNFFSKKRKNKNNRVQETILFLENFWHCVTQPPQPQKSWHLL